MSLYVECRDVNSECLTTNCNNCANNISHLKLAAAIKAVVEHEEIYCWHDLRKDPEDLPKEDWQYDVAVKTVINMKPSLNGMKTRMDIQAVGLQECRVLEQ